MAPAELSKHGLELTEVADLTAATSVSGIAEVQATQDAGWILGNPHEINGFGPMVPNRGLWQVSAG